MARKHEPIIEKLLEIMEDDMELRINRGFGDSMVLKLSKYNGSDLSKSFHINRALTLKELHTLKIGADEVIIREISYMQNSIRRAIDDNNI